VKRRDEKLPNLRHGLESAAAERVCIGGNTAPAQDAKSLGIGGGFHCGAGTCCSCGRKKCQAQAEDFWQFDALLFRASPEKFVRERGEQAGAVTASTIGVHSAAVSEAFEGRQRNVYDFMAGGATEARYKTSATGIVVGMAPVGVPIAPGWCAPSVHNN